MKCSCFVALMASHECRDNPVTPASVCHSLQRVAAIYSESPLFIQLRGQRVTTHYSGLSSHDLTVTSFREMPCGLSTSALISRQSYQLRGNRRSEVILGCFLRAALCQRCFLNGCKYCFDTRRERSCGSAVELNQGLCFPS